MSDVTRGERGPVGDHGQAGQDGQDGQDGRGGIGERGPTGDHGQDGRDGRDGVGGIPGPSGIVGPRGAQGAAGYTYLQPAKSRTALILGLGATFALLATVFMTLVVTFRDEARKNGRIADLSAQLRVATDRADAAADLAATERSLLLAQIDELQTAQAEERLVDDCVTLYTDDIATGVALSQIALADLFAQAVARGVPVTDADRAAALEDNRRLVAELDAANAPLRAAVQALADYRLIDPPPEACPHPNAD